MLKILRKLDDIVSMLLMAFIILLACANVFMRYVVGSPWGWVEEVTIFTFVWLTMIGAASVIKAEGHCSIDVLARKLSPKARRVLDTFVDLCVIITLLLMIYYGLELTLSAGGKITPMLGIPYTYIDAAIPVSGLIMLVYYVQIAWNNITGKGQNSQTEESQ
jgi:TRAP-type C4-dicarboxylate transport system permease small subunit